MFIYLTLKFIRSHWQRSLKSSCALLRSPTIFGLNCVTAFLRKPTAGLTRPMLVLMRMRTSIRGSSLNTPSKQKSSHLDPQTCCTKSPRRTPSKLTLFLGSQFRYLWSLAQYDSFAFLQPTNQANWRLVSSVKGASSASQKFLHWDKKGSCYSQRRI